MEYLPTDLPQYVKTHNRTAFSNAAVKSGHALLFSEDGESLTAKLPDGSFVDVGGSGIDFYKCASVTAPGILVSGAGDDRVNGLYNDTGETMNDEPIYSMTKNGFTSYYYKTKDKTWEHTISQTIYDGNHNEGSGSAQYIKPYNSAAWQKAYYGTNPAPTVTAVIPEDNSWTGYKAIQDSTTGEWSYAETVTSGLEYKGFIPNVGDVYNADATAKTELYTGT